MLMELTLTTAASALPDSIAPMLNWELLMEPSAEIPFLVNGTKEEATLSPALMELSLGL